MRFLFWNLRRRPLASAIARLVRTHEIDVLMLAECDLDDGVLLGAVERHAGYSLARVQTRANVRLYVREDRADLALVLEGDRFTIRHLQPRPGEPILLAAAHLASKAHSGCESQSFESIGLSRAIQEAEEEVGHRRTVLVGDLNQNPHEPGVIGAMALHAVPTRMLAAGRERHVQGVSYPMFYNPMWNFFGDETRGPPGTYFYRRSEHVCQFWNMFDQVLVRPDLLSRFDTSDLEILVDDGAMSLATAQGRPGGTAGSDHFPLVFRLNLE